MKKDDLIELLTKEGQASKAPAKPKKKGPAAKTAKVLDRSEIKSRIRALKEEKREALTKEDRAKAKQCNREIHHLKRKLRKLVREKAAKN
jgi:hypothetical protein